MNLLGSVLGGLLGDQQMGRAYMELGKAAQEHNENLHMLSQAGPSHCVVRARWKERHGWETVIASTFPNDVAPEVVDAWKRGNGWLGHGGTSWDYLKDDLAQICQRAIRQMRRN